MESELLAWEEKPLADAQALRIIKQKSTGTGFEMNNHKAASGIEPSIGHMVDEEARLKTSIGGKGKTHERRTEKTFHTSEVGRLQREIEKELHRRFSPGALRAVKVRGTSVRAAVQRLGKVLGHRVTFVQSSTSEEVVYADAHFMGGDIFIDNHTAEPHMVLLGHELTHKIKSQAPALYAGARGEGRIRSQNILERDKVRRRKDGVLIILTPPLADSDRGDLGGTERHHWLGGQAQLDSRRQSVVSPPLRGPRMSKRKNPPKLPENWRDTYPFTWTGESPPDLSSRLRCGKLPRSSEPEPSQGSSKKS